MDQGQICNRALVILNLKYVKYRLNIVWPVSASQLGRIPMRDDVRIGRLSEILEGSLAASAEEMARTVGLSKSRLSHLFKSQIGLTIRQYQMQKRLEKAATLLSMTSLSIKEIAFRVGYSHPTNFIRAFRKRYRLTPSESRTLCVQPTQVPPCAREAGKN